SMSNAPYYLRGYRNGVKFGNQELVDGLIHDGLWCAFGHCHMGGHAEYTAWKAGITREEADEFSLASHRKAIAAIDAGKFKDEIVPVEIQSRKGSTIIDTDEPPRRDTSLEALSKLRRAVVSDRPEEADEFSLASHRKAIAAIDAGKFKDEIVPVEIQSREGSTIIDTDEPPRRDTSLEALSKLRPAFVSDMPEEVTDPVVTAGNAPGLNDGAAAVVVTSQAYAEAHGLPILARINAYATGAVSPRELFFAPVRAVRRVMEKEG